MREDKGNTLRKLTGKGVGWVVSDSAGPREPSPKLAARKAEGASPTPKHLQFRKLKTR